MKKFTTQEIHAITDEENFYQDGKWGENRGHEVGGWLTIMQAHLTKAANLWASSSGDEEALHEIRKVIAVGVRCGQEHGLSERV